MNVDVVTGTAIQQAIPEVQYEGSDIIGLFAGGVGSGIVFITGIFIVSLMINAFFDIIKK